MNTRNRIGNVLWGLAFILIGLGFAGQAFRMWDFNLFFDGWWTLFIIVPCAIGIIQRGPHTGNIIGLTIGLLLLLMAQDIIRWSTIGDLIVPLILVIIGLGFIFRNNHQNRNHDAFANDDFCVFNDVNTNTNTNDNTNNNANFNNGSGVFSNTQEKGSANMKEISAIFGGRKVTYQNEPFTGANINSIFGGVELNLRDAYMNGHIDVQVTSVFGGTEIFVPDNVRVEVNSVPIFGGVTNKAMNPVGDVRAVLHINATCMFGGVEIK